MGPLGVEEYQPWHGVVWLVFWLGRRRIVINARRSFEGQTKTGMSGGVREGKNKNCAECNEAK